MSPVVKWTLRQRKWSIIWWCIGVIFFIFLTLIFYPSIRDQSAQLDKSFREIPDTARQLFTDTGDLFSPVGYLSSQIFYLMLPLLIAILAINLGVSLLGKEESDTTIEMLLSRPLSRGKLLIGKFITGLVIVALITLISTLFTVLMCRLVNLNADLLGIIQAGLAVGLMAVCFGAVAFMITALGRSGRAAAIAIATAFALGGYVIASLAASVEWLHWPAKIFPFSYYHSSQLLTGHYNWANSLYFIAVTAGCLVVSWLSFRRRDLLGS